MGKDYTYRGTWKHKFSRARNKAQRGGLSKKEMLEKYGRFPRKDECGVRKLIKKSGKLGGLKRIQNINLNLV